MNTFLDSSRATSTLKGRVINWSKSRLSFPGHVPGAVTLQYDALYGRLEEVPDGVGADGSGGWMVTMMMMTTMTTMIVMI